MYRFLMYEDDSEGFDGKNYQIRRFIKSEAQDKHILLYYFMCILGSADDFVIRRRSNKLT